MKRNEHVGTDEELCKPLSAFAARQATKEPLVKTDSTSTPGDFAQQDAVIRDDEPVRPKKVRKLQPEDETLTTARKSSTLFANSTFVQDESTIEYGVPAVTNDQGTLGAEALSGSTKSCIKHPEHEDSDGSEAQSEHQGEGSVSDISPFGGNLSIQRLSSFSPAEQNVKSQSISHWSIVLRGRDILTLVGQYDIWVRRGAVNILGAVLRPSSQLYRVYAPSTHSLPSLRQLQDPFGPPEQSAEISIIASKTGIRSLKHASPLFRRIWNHKHDSEVFGQSFAHLQTSADDRYQRPVRRIEPLGDRQLLVMKLLTEKRRQPPAVMICGPKGSGKSTFARILTNAVLTRSASTSRNDDLSMDGVALLDLDPGQPEFSPPGDLSLVHLKNCYFGPPFTHPMILGNEGDRVIRAHHYGFLSSRENSEHYMSCIRDLVKHYRALRQQHSSCPLVVNCAGWTQGAGLDLLRDLIRSQGISDIVYTSTRGPREVVEALAEAAKIASSALHTLSSHETGMAMRSSAALRSMQTLSYFHLAEPESGRLRWDQTAITEQRPLVVPWSGVEQGLFAVVVLHEGLDANLLFAALNGCCVGLVAIEDDHALPNYRTPRGKTEVPDKHGDQIRQGAEQEHEMPSLTPGPPVEVSLTPTIDSAITIEKPACSISEPERASCSELDEPDPDEVGLSKGLSPYSGVSRNSEDMPYIKFDGRGRTYIDPARSHALGQALVRGIDLEAKCFHLLTPVSAETFQRCSQQRTRIVMVRGKLDPPDWAFREEYERGAAFRRKVRKEDPEAADRWKAHDLRQWADRTPYVNSIDEPRLNSVSAKVWRVRTDMKPRASGHDTDE